MIEPETTFGPFALQLAKSPSFLAFLIAAILFLLFVLAKVSRALPILHFIYDIFTEPELVQICIRPNPNAPDTPIGELEIFNRFRGRQIELRSVHIDNPAAPHSADGFHRKTVDLVRPRSYFRVSLAANILPAEEYRITLTYAVGGKEQTVSRYLCGGHHAHTSPPKPLA